MADIVCPVCGTHNPPTRTFCLKCAADLHAPVPDATTVVPTPRAEIPLKPILVGGGVALAAIVVIAVLVVAAGTLGASPAPSAGPSAGATEPAAPTDAATSGASGAASPEASEAPVATPTPKPTAGAPATPKITPIPAPSIVEFKGPKTVDCTDPQFSGFIHLTWLVDNADSTQLSIDGPGVYKSYPGVLGQDDVPFGCGAGQHTYTLTTVGGAGPAATKTLTITEG
jgi:hypothetical protein